MDGLKSNVWVLILRGRNETTNGKGRGAVMCQGRGSTPAGSNEFDKNKAYRRFPSLNDRICICARAQEATPLAGYISMVHFGIRTSNSTKFWDGITMHRRTIRYPLSGKDRMKEVKFSSQEHNSLFEGEIMGKVPILDLQG